MSLSGIEFKLSKLAEVWDDLSSLTYSHFLEISYHVDWKFELDKAMYLAADSAGRYKIFTVWHNGELIGYAGYFVSRHPHVNILQAYQDMIYLRPDYRKLNIGAQLIEFADSMLKNLGISVVFCAVTEKVDYSKTIIPMGYKLVDRLYARRL